MHPTGAAALKGGLRRVTTLNSWCHHQRKQFQDKLIQRWPFLLSYGRRSKRARLGIPWYSIPILTYYPHVQSKCQHQLTEHSNFHTFLQICSHNDKICFTNNQSIPFELCKCYLFVWHTEYILKHITMVYLITDDQSWSRRQLGTTVPLKLRCWANKQLFSWSLSKVQTLESFNSSSLFRFECKFTTWCLLKTGPQICILQLPKNIYFFSRFKSGGGCIYQQNI